ncbi:MAG TPA: class I SAM-dependent methyltransferase [Syntrophorhabdaceae bacterium]|jgi:demethylmenaquinone methyltransferase/2-methoxy-6-polyprenyl-1,4-benzoquinol methylase|nr:class I SAM-dependent methyltransferase [Syntrophorhabdaceae bacterium]HOS05364.1 class I SAM-dependent methyltransferase [Syntrophorhabdaceae bacterium]HPL40662.1 class I SAM-dependent methyltransferase [Syntrophorhabdaceae bacterium]HPN98915.1 class I SAM-dependent methyltransferase [Syntrophorhabdaceae bacterium]HQM75941.1 class I SAM-dependent methyltransferase [Syntrophorhabdaceae bacterium]
MNMARDEIYLARKRFFNDHADKWIDMWYKDHSSGRYDKHAKDFARLFSLAPLKQKDTVLDVGCGTGILVPFVLERIGVSGTIYEMDFAEKMIENNRNIHKQPNIKFLIADAENTPLDDNSCDVVICFSCFPHFHDKNKALKRLSRVLKPHGVFVVAHFDSSEGINKHHRSCHAVMHDHLPDKASMYDIFEKVGLDINHFIDEAGFYCIIAKKDVCDIIFNNDIP